jgi:glutaredoxin
MDKNNTQGLVLFEYFTCPFCFMTRRVIKQLGIDIERRDILKNPDFKQELIKGGGKSQVPCLRIEENNQLTWLYESVEIIGFLKSRFAVEVPQ